MRRREMFLKKLMADLLGVLEKKCVGGKRNNVNHVIWFLKAAFVQG